MHLAMQQDGGFVSHTLVTNGIAIMMADLLACLESRAGLSAALRSPACLPAC